jgi:asparagine synthase (glutamine-hydrolysing)
MCGIAGYHGFRELDEKRLATCLGLMHRRGPDQAGVRRFDIAGGRRAYLLSTRLSIIDLDERASQPFQVGAKSMVYNGELYNYVELRASLRSKGCGFSTDSDTEVLLRALDHEGWPVLDRCEGMWAFAVLDAVDGSLTLCRDRFGEKPLYLYRDETGVYFGSEVKFISRLLGRTLRVNLDHVSRYLVNGYKSLYKDGHAFFDGLSELPPAFILRLDASGSEKQWTYWEARFDPDEGMSYEEAVEGARDHLIESVRLRLRADVPLAFCMSGGVDSNALISIAKNVLQYDVHGFTIVNRDERYDEQAMVDESVRSLGIRHTAVDIDTRDFLEKLRVLVRQHDAPVYTITYYAHWLLMDSIASGGYRVSVSGTAADELFTGYYDHHLFYLHDIHGDPELFESSRQAWQKHICPLVRNPYLRNLDWFLEHPEERRHIFLDADGFSEYLVSGWKEPFAERPLAPSVLRNRMLNEMFDENVPVILHEDDLNAMYFSVENRSPYLDRQLFEFCYRIPTRHLIRDGRAKAVLRDSMRGIAPAAIIDNRRKVGFNAPIFSFLDVRNPAVRAALLEDSPVFDLVRRDRIEGLIDKVELPNSESKFLFYFLNAKIFLEEFGS